MMETIVWVVVLILLGVACTFIPRKYFDKITDIFSLQDIGVRYIRRRRDNTDTLANIFLFVALVFSIFYFILPGYTIIYSVLLVLSFLCVLAQTNRVMQKASKGKWITVFLCVYAMAAIGLASAIGLFNNFACVPLVTTFEKDLFAGSVFDVFYILQNPCVVAYVLQGILFFIPMYWMWAQFKYMRLENTYKGYNVVTFSIKVIIICAFVAYISMSGFDFINLVYQVEYKEA